MWQEITDVINWRLAKTGVCRIGFIVQKYVHFECEKIDTAYVEERLFELVDDVCYITARTFALHLDQEGMTCLCDVKERVEETLDAPLFFRKFLGLDIITYEDMLSLRGVSKEEISFELNEYLKTFKDDPVVWIVNERIIKGDSSPYEDDDDDVTTSKFELVKAFVDQ